MSICLEPGNRSGACNGLADGMWSSDAPASSSPGRARLIFWLFCLRFGDAIIVICGGSVCQAQVGLNVFPWEPTGARW